MKRCLKCGESIPANETGWNGLCQMCWEALCSEAWWDSVGGKCPA